MATEHDAVVDRLRRDVMEACRITTHALKDDISITWQRGRLIICSSSFGTTASGVRLTTLPSWIRASVLMIHLPLHFFVSRRPAQ